MGSLLSRPSPLIANKKEKTQTSKQTEAEEKEGERKGERVGKKKGKSQDQLSYSSASYPHFIWSWKNASWVVPKLGREFSHNMYV